jgi:hypothetical protein
VQRSALKTDDASQYCHAAAFPQQSFVSELTVRTLQAHSIACGIRHDEVVAIILIDVPKEIEGNDFSSAFLTIDCPHLGKFNQFFRGEVVAQDAAGLDKEQCVSIAESTDIVSDQVGTGTQGQQRLSVAIGVVVNSVDRQALSVIIITSGQYDIPLVTSQVGGQYRLLHVKSRIDDNFGELRIRNNGAGRYQGHNCEAKSGAAHDHQ